jgi:hypothetical protein
MVAPVKRIDQIYCRVESVGDVNKLYYLFSNTLGFPEAWPPTDKKEYYGGGVYTGNTWLKWVSYNTKAYKMTDKPAKFQMISLEPNGYERCIKELEKREIATKYDGNATVADSSGEEQEWGQSYDLIESPFKEVNLFICKYSPLAFSALTTTPEAKNLDEHYRIMRGRLNEVGGGPLGIRYVKEVELGVKGFIRDSREWQRLLDPIKPKGELWRIGKGPELRLTPEKNYSIKGISIRVKSLRVARKFLKLNGLLGEVNEGWVSLSRDRVNNLDLRFVK